MSDLAGPFLSSRDDIKGNYLKGTPLRSRNWRKPQAIWKWVFHGYLVHVDHVCSVISPPFTDPWGTWPQGAGYSSGTSSVHDDELYRLRPRRHRIYNHLKYNRTYRKYLRSWKEQTADNLLTQACFNCSARSGPFLGNSFWWSAALRRYAILDRPQLGAYFLAFRKTKALEWGCVRRLLKGIKWYSETMTTWGKSILEILESGASL